jgi:opacity protein-like surface antigen
MSKRILSLLAALLTVVSGVSAAGFLDRWSLRLSPGGIMPLGGQYDDVTKLGKVVSIGAGLAGGLRYRVNDYVYVGADYGLTWMRVKKDYEPFDYKEMGPALNVMMLTVNTTFVLSTGFGINPYVTFGAGLYPWKFSQKPLWGAPWPAPADPTKTFAMSSFGFNTGLGAEKHVSSRLSVFVEVMYHYIFSRNPAKFGTDDFNQQDFLGLNVGLSFALGKK